MKLKIYQWLCYRVSDLQEWVEDKRNAAWEKEHPSPPPTEEERRRYQAMYDHYLESSPWTNLLEKKFPKNMGDLTLRFRQHGDE